MSKNKVRSEQLKLEILNVIGRFGWLRIREISQIVWPEANEKNAFKYADEHLRRLQQEGYVQFEMLPELAGTAVILQSKAIRFLKNEGIEVTKVSFNPHTSSEWKHDLLTSSLFVLLINNRKCCAKNAKYLTDRECKRVKKESTNLVRELTGDIKVPDLILETKNWGVLAIEVERSPKSGLKHKDQLVKNLILTNKQEPPYIYGDLTPKYVVVAYDNEQKIIRDGKEQKVSHDKNIFNRVGQLLSEFAVEKIRLIAFGMYVKHHTAINFGVKHEKVARQEIKDFIESDVIFNGKHFDVSL